MDDEKEKTCYKFHVGAETVFLITCLIQENVISNNTYVVIVRIRVRTSVIVVI